MWSKFALPWPLFWLQGRLLMKRGHSASLCESNWAVMCTFLGPPFSSHVLQRKKKKRMKEKKKKEKEEKKETKEKEEGRTEKEEEEERQREREREIERERERMNRK